MPLKVLSGSSLSMHLYTYVPILMAITTCNGHIAHHSLIGTMALQECCPRQVSPVTHIPQMGSFIAEADHYNEPCV